MRIIASTLLALIAVCGLIVWVIAGRQARSRRQLTKHVYRHMDELLGARRYEADRSATRRHWLSYLDKDLAALLYPSPKLGGTMVLPPYRRMQLYVELILDPVAPPHPYRKHHIQGAVLHWTSEAPVNSGSYFEWLEKGRATSGGGLAQALGLEWSEGLFTQNREHAHSRVTMLRKKTVSVPNKISAREALDD